MVGGLDWSQTPGFALRTDVRAELRLNLVNRESKGWLKPESPSHRTYVELLKRTFLELKNVESGQRLVDEVVPIQELFPGERSHALPDFAITWRAAPLARCVASQEIGELVVRPVGARGGDHTDFGFVAVSPSQALEARLSSSGLPQPNHTWDLAKLFAYLDSVESSFG
jgi:hypothetical protein